MIDLANMLSLSCFVLGLWGMLNAAQWHISAAQWREGGALGWDLQGVRASRLYGGRWLFLAFSSVAFPFIRCAQFAASFLLCVMPIGWVALGALVIIAITNVLLIFRSTGDGGDKMAMVVTYGMALQMLGAITAQPLLAFAGTLWIGGQLTLCYVTSGFSKSLLSDWRNGAVPKRALSSYNYGNRMTHILMRHPAVVLTLAWAIILIETLFPLALFAPTSVLIAALGGMALLHMGIAFAMGLNTYVFAFIAAYPSVMLLAKYIKDVNLPLWQ